MKNIIRLFFVFACILSQPLFATKYTWTGNTSTNWTVNTNWSPNGVPSTTDTVKIVSTSNGPILQANTTVKELEYTSGSLNLNTYSLTVSNNSYFYAGTISNGNLILRGTYSLFNGTTFSCTIDAVVGRTVFSGGTFNSTASFEQTSTSTSNGAGGCTFNAAVTIKKTGNSYLNLGMTNADVFNGVTKIINTSTYAIQLGYNTVSSINDSLIIESTGAGGVNFAIGSASGGATLASGKIITIGSGGFTNGSLILKNFTQNGSTAQNITTSTSAIVSLVSSTFNGALTLSSPGILIKTSTFNGVTDFTKSSNTTNQSDGGNTFNAAVTFRNTATNPASFRLALQERDIFNSDVTFITTTGYISPAFNGISEFKGNVSINSSLVIFNIGTGTVSCTGTNSQTFTGSANYAIGKLLINKPSGNVTLSRPVTLDSSLTLTNGKIITSTTNILSFKATSFINGGNVNSFIEGPVKKIGNTAFKFAIGKGNDYRPVSISNPSTVTDAYTAEYFNSGQTLGSSLDTSINYISDCNYYKIDRNNGTSNVNLTFNWLNKQCDVFDVDSTKLARWSGTKWNVLGLMSYTGNDSIGSNSRSSVGEFGYFTFGHKLFPRVSYSYTIDTTAYPMKVEFVNTSKGIANNTKFIWVYGDVLNNIARVDTVLNKNSRTHFYSSKYNHSPILKAIIGLDTLSFTTRIVVNILEIRDLALNINSLLSNQHNPPLSSNPIISTCYDELRLSFLVENFEGAIPPLANPKLEFTFPNYINLVSVFSSSSPSTNFSLTIDAVTNSVVLTNISNTASALGSIPVDIVFNLNNCNVYTNANLPILANLQLSNSSSTQTGPNLTLSSISNYLSICQSPYDPLCLEIGNIQRPALKFNELDDPINSIYSHNNECFTKFEVIDRYYEIKSINGYTDLFSLKVKLEEDIELLKLEVISSNLSNANVVKTIYDHIASPIPGGEELTMYFYSPNNSTFISNTTPPTAQIAPVQAWNGLNNIFLVPLNECLDRSLAVNPIGINSLYNEDDANHSNSIVIHEQIKVAKVNNCNNITTSSTLYTLGYICDKTTPTIEVCTEIDFNLNVNSELIKSRITASPAKYVSGVSPSYQVIDEGDLGICSTANKPSIDYTIKISNLPPNSPSNTCIPIKSGMVKLKKMQFNLNTELFNVDLDEVYFGTTKVDVTKPNPAINIYEIDFNTQPSLTFFNDPNLPSTTNGVVNSLNSKFPFNPQYLFLPVGHEIGVTFKNVSMKDCSSNDFYLDDKDYNGKYFYLTSGIKIYYQNMCDFGTQDDQLFDSQDALDMSNRFTGYASGISYPVDITATSPFSKLTYEFHNTTLPAGSARHPWQLQDRARPTFDNLLDCPDIEYYATIKMPPPPANQNLTTSSLFYPVSVTVTGNDGIFNNITANSSTITPTSNPFEYEIHWSFNGVTYKDVVIEVVVAMDCQGLEDYGNEDFDLEFRERCDNNCPSCYNLYAYTSASLFRHCFGECTKIVSTSNFTMKRSADAVGWTSLQEYIAQPSNPDALPVANLIKVYPCDLVHIESTNGLSGDQNGGIPGITGLYFDILIAEGDIDNNQLFDFSAAGALGHFEIIPPPCSLCVPFTVDILSTDLSFTPSPLPNNYTPGFNLHRISLNLTEGISYPGDVSVLTVGDLLRNYMCQINVSIDINVDYIGSLANGAYDIDAARGQFTTDYNGGLDFEESCDPWAQNLKYLKITPTVAVDLYGPNASPYLDGDQCQLIYSMRAQIPGGYLDDDDFENEFRPIFNFPRQLQVNLFSGLDYSYGKFFNEQTSQSVQFNRISLTSNTHTIQADPSATFDNVIEKDGPTDAFFSMALHRNCASENDFLGNVVLDVNPFTNFFINTCNIPTSFTTNFKYDPVYNTNSLVDVFTQDELKFEYTSSSPFVVSTNPTIEPIDFNISFKPWPFNKFAPDCWIYFETSLPVSPIRNITLELFEVGVANPVPYIINPLTNEQVFKLGDISKGTKRNYKLYFSYSDCNTGNSTYDPITLTPHYGSSCTGYNPIDLPTIVSCGNLAAGVFVCEPQTSSIGLVILSTSPTVVNDCGTFQSKIEVTSTGSDLKTSRLRVTVPNSININFPNSSIETLLSNGGPLTSITLPFVASVPNANPALKDYVWEVNNILGSVTGFNIAEVHFNSNSPYSTVVFNLDFSVTGSINSPFTFTALSEAISVCDGDPLYTSQVTSPQISYSGTPAALAVISGNATLCNGSSTSLNATLQSANATNINYSWTGPSSFSSTSSSISFINQAGVYNVAISYLEFGVTCTSYASIEVIDLTPVFIPSTTNICDQNQVITIENTLTPVNNNYTYIWSDGSTTFSGNELTIPTNLTWQPSYSVTVTNFTCSTTTSVPLNFISPTCTLTASSSTYCNPNLVLLTLTPSGSSSFPELTSFAWSNGISSTISTPSSFETLEVGAGIYSCTVSYGGCTFVSNSITITDISIQPTISFDPVNFQGICNGSSVVLTANPSGMSYNWSNSTTPIIATTQDITVNASETYSVTVTNALTGCNGTISTTIDDITPTVNVSANNLIYCSPNAILLTTTVAPNNFTYDYTWDHGPTNDIITVSPTGNTTYTVTVENQAGCTSSASITIDVGTQPSLSIGSPSICDGVLVDLIPTTLCNGCSYLWSDGSTNSTLNIGSAGNYTVTITDANGCTNSATSTVTSFTPAISIISPINIIGIPGTVTQLIQPNYSNCNSCSYLWSSSETTSSISPIIPNTGNNYYTITATNTGTSGLECSASATVNVVLTNPYDCPQNWPELKSVDFSSNTVIYPPASPLGGYIINSNIDVTADIIIAQKVNFAISKDVKIVIKNGASLYFEDGGHLYSCGNDMWHGIIVEPGGKLLMRSDLYQMLVEDAKVAVEAYENNTINSPNTEISITGSNTIFEANNVGIYLHDGDFDDAIFNGTKFTCDKNLEIPFFNNVRSLIHFRADNAGTVNLKPITPSSNYNNEFFDAFYCIKASNTNLNVEACRFNQLHTWGLTNPNGPSRYSKWFAIEYEGESNVSEPMSNLKSVHIGENGSSNLKNKFEACLNSIFINNRVRTTIERNDFSDGETAIQIQKNNNSTIDVSNNISLRISRTAMRFADNDYSRVYVSYNDFDFVPITFDPDFEGQTAILINNAKPTYNPDELNTGGLIYTSLLVGNNRINNYRKGITVYKQKTGNIYNNSITYNVDDIYLDYSLNIRRYGISIINSETVTVQENQISRLCTGCTLNSDFICQDLSSPTNCQGTLMAGINEQNSSSIISNNLLSTLPTGIRINDNCVGSVFKCNDIVSGLQGFKLDGPTGFTVISSQGLSDEPNGNKWVGGTFNSKIYGTGQNIQKSWFYNNNISDEIPGTSFVTNLLPVIVTNVGNYCDNNGGGCTSCDVDRLYVILNEADTSVMNEELRFSLRNYVYRNLKDSLQLMYTGSTHDAELQNFFTIMSLNNLGLLNNVDDLLRNNDYANALLLNESINSDQLIVENLAIVNRIVADYEFDFREIDSISRQQLEYIAYQYPQIGGEAVYRARAILGIDFEDSFIAYRLPSQKDNSNSSDFKLLPNPNSGLFNLEYNLKENTNAVAEIFDNFGKLITKIQLESQNKNFSFDLSNVEAGVYSLRIGTSDGQVITKKVFIIK